MFNLNEMENIMFATKVRNPQDKLMKDVQNFASGPKARAERIVRIGKQEGYSFIQAAAQGLLLMSLEADDIESFRYAAMLTQPEWKFHKTSDPKAVAIAVDCEGDSTVLGFYTTGEAETGAVSLSTDLTGIRLLDEVKDPRMAFTSTRIKQKIWRKGRKYFVIECAKSRADLETFYSEDRILETRKPGYLWKFDAFVITDGPFKTREEASEARIKTHKA